MITLLHSGKFWLKLIVFGCSAIITLLAIDVAVLHYLFNAEEIQKRADALVAESGHQVIFDHDISRSLFPRPTVTLRQLHLVNTSNHANDINVGTMKIGLGWQSIFGKPTIEKWQITNADIHLIRNNQRQWNLADLWQKSSSKNTIKVNRFILENAHISIQDAGQIQDIGHVNLQLNKLDANSNLLQLNGQLNNKRIQKLQYQISAIYRPNAVLQWQDVKLNVNNKIRLLGKTSSQWHFDARWLPNLQQLKTGAVQWQWQSEYEQLHISGTGQNWQVGWDKLLLPQLNGVATAQLGDNIINATITASNTSWQPNQWAIEQFQINSGWQSHLYQTALILNGQLSWPNNRHWQINNFSINSHQDSINRLPNSRFSSDLTGVIQGDENGNAQLSLQGQFDNQPMNIALNYYTEKNQDKLNGNINFSQLNLRPYIENNGLSLPDNWQKVWQQLLTNRSINCQINIDSLLTPSIQLNQIKSNITADAHTLDLNPLSIKMYGGSSSGMMKISNSFPLTWKIQQHISSVQIKSFLQDAFGLHNLDGEGTAYLDFNSSGADQHQWLSNLKGTAQIEIFQGILNGIDINNILQNNNNQATLTYNETSQTPFRSIKLNIPIVNGETQNSHIQLHADNFDIKGNGKMKWSQQQMEYNVLIATRRANVQNFLPLRINGSFTRPSFTIDYKRLTAGLHTSQQKQDSLRQTLQQQWLWLNQGASDSTETHDLTKKP